MEHYVLVVGPMDSVFIGPFADDESAQAWMNKQDASGRGDTFDFFPMTKEEMEANCKEFGPCPIQSPEECRDAN